ncbi:guanine deaminase [Gordonia hirsuta DSM 44140 = NBRC 16056]|uniref:Guanine deaminase n=1 Tax=Gordonia hirsuta DSM 44140 = NBRC 16056 TaxID=1121927 RepID=L7L699_9ACTN|nr:guanine deaminase [Gordonia hirsuta]GAC56675.1 guanine deaminase [Gordonia hirsuta DSM 44140 = NBRC 16056]
MPEITVLRGHAVTFTGDPFIDPGAFVDVPDALIVVTDGIITAFGAYDDVAGQLPEGVPVTDYRPALISAGFIDTHVHYVQTGIIGAYGDRLLEWLNNYSFVEEQRFSSAEYAARAAALFFDQLLANGTTTAVTFAAVYPQSAEAFFQESARRNTRMIGGKVMMDRNAPAPLLDTPESAYAQSKELLERWDGTGRNHYAITPRFAPTSSPAQLAMAGRLRQEHPTAFVHTHISETLTELALVKELFPDRTGYLDVYGHYGLIGERTVLAHGIHLTAPERDRIAQAGALIAHCPTSNLFLGSGLFDLHQAKDAARPLHVGLGTDIGAGTSFSLLATMNEAYKVAALRSHPLSALKSFYLATRGAAVGLGLADKIGSIAVGGEADLVVLDPAATPLLAYRTSRAQTTEEVLFALTVLGDDRAVAATYVAGALAHTRSP